MKPLLRTLLAIVINVSLIYTIGCKGVEENWTIDILKPYLEGEFLKNGESYIIQWESDFTGAFNVDLLKSGEYITTLASNHSAVYYSWKVEGISAAEDYSVKVSISDKPAFFAESNLFEVLPEIPDSNVEFIEEDLIIDDKMIRLYTAGQGGTTILFEHGLGGDASVWFWNRLLNTLAEDNVVIAYNRSGYTPSTYNGESRGMANITNDLNEIIEQKVGNNKLILVGWSWGGPIIRYFTIYHPEKVDALLFIDPSHESGNDISQEREDALVANAINSGNIGEELEAMQMVETFVLLSNLAELPDIPVVVLTALQVGGFEWINSHAELGAGVTDFTHKGVDSPHAIQYNEPEVVYKYVLQLLEKI
ncbi:MAG: alpha/beta hydrolase [Bacteroidota bacterium]